MTQQKNKNDIHSGGQTSWVTQGSMQACGGQTDGGQTRGDKTEQKADRTEAASITDAGRALRGGVGWVGADLDSGPLRE